MRVRVVSSALDANSAMLKQVWERKECEQKYTSWVKDEVFCIMA
jgi:hypothetical protein